MSSMIKANALLLLLLLPFCGAAAAVLLPSGRNAEAWLAGTVALVGLAVTISLYPAIAAGQVVRHDIAWLPTWKQMPSASDA